MQHMYFTIGDRGHIQFIHLRTMMKEGNECPRSVKFCLQRQRWKNPQQDQNQLNGNERVPVVCVRNLWKSDWNYERELARQSGLPRVFKTLNEAQLAKKVANRYRPSVPNAIWSLQNSCDMYDLRWPRRHLFDWQYHQFRWTCEGNISCYILTCLHARQGLPRPLAMLIRRLFWRAFDNGWDDVRSSEP